MTTTIPLTRGKVTLVNDKDVAKLAGWTWRAVYRKGRNLWYAQGYRGGLKTREDVYMHQLVAGAKRGKIVDHKDGDGLNNRRRNLRHCTVRQNVLGAGVRPHSSRYKGVYWSKRDRVWRAQIGVHRKIICLGNFRDEGDAGRAYNKAARKHYGEFARLNEVAR